MPAILQLSVSEVRSPGFRYCSLESISSHMSSWGALARQLRLWCGGDWWGWKMLKGRKKGGKGADGWWLVWWDKDFEENWSLMVKEDSLHIFRPTERKAKRSWLDLHRTKRQCGQVIFKVWCILCYIVIVTISMNYSDWCGVVCLCLRSCHDTDIFVRGYFHALYQQWVFEYMCQFIHGCILALKLVRLRKCIKKRKTATRLCWVEGPLSLQKMLLDYIYILSIQGAHLLQKHETFWASYSWLY